MHCPPPHAGGDLGVVKLSPVSWPACSPHSLCSPLGEVGVGPEGSSARHCSPYIKGGAGQGVRPSPVMGWGLSTNQEASLSPAPLGQPFLSPVPSSPGWHLTFWGSEGRPPQEVPRGEGPAPPGSLGESWPPGRRVCGDPSLCAWRWAKC